MKIILTNETFIKHHKVLLVTELISVLIQKPMEKSCLVFVEGTRVSTVLFRSLTTNMLSVLTMVETHHSHLIQKWFYFLNNTRTKRRHTKTKVWNCNKCSKHIKLLKVKWKYQKSDILLKLDSNKGCTPFTNLWSRYGISSFELQYCMLTSSQPDDNNTAREQLKNSSCTVLHKGVRLPNKQAMLHCNQTAVWCKLIDRPKHKGYSPIRGKVVFNDWPLVLKAKMAYRDI